MAGIYGTGRPNSSEHRNRIGTDPRTGAGPAGAEPRRTGPDTAGLDQREADAMVFTASLAQFPVGWDVDANLAHIRRILDACPEGEWAVFPEGAVSGYGNDMAALTRLSAERIDAALAELARIGAARGLHVFVGSLVYEAGAWVNAALYLPPVAAPSRYRKVNLATHERGHLHPGTELPVIPVLARAQEVRVAVQLCRELRFPEQWQWLARSGAQVFVHLNNANGEAVQDAVWKSHLVSRAAENQRFVLSANAAHPAQVGPTLAVDPRGIVLTEAPRGRDTHLRVTVDTARVSDWYLSQARRDVVAVQGTGG